MQPGLAMAQVILAHALFERDGPDGTDERICGLCRDFLQWYPQLQGISEDARHIYAALDCDRGEDSLLNDPAAGPAGMGDVYAQRMQMHNHVV